MTIKILSALWVLATIASNSLTTITAITLAITGVGIAYPSD